MTGELTAYDRVAYPARCYAQTHPDRLRLAARLCGLDPPELEHCRVLELGCGEGSNLIAMAVAMPSSNFLGIDVAERAIQVGQELITELELGNVQLVKGDISNLEPDLGTFDYIAAHGIYSWVPEEVRDGLLRSCRRHLTPNGVAYVSYSAYPGAHFRNLVREQMLFHAGELADPAERVARGVEFLRFVKAAEAGGKAYAAVLEHELVRLSGDPGYVFHDDFAETNDPCYMSEFAAHARAHGLQFFAEANFSFFADPLLPGEVRKKLEALGRGDLIAEQQYLDFVRCCAFRQSLICHGELSPSRRPNIERLLELYAASGLQPASADHDFAPGANMKFDAPKGGFIETTEPLVKAAFVALGDVWPDALRVSELLARASGLAGFALSSANQAQALALLFTALLRSAALQVVELSTRPPRFAVRPGERPRATGLSRLQAQRGTLVMSLRHAQINLEDDASRCLICLLDGTRDRADLLAALREALAKIPNASGTIDEAELDAVLVRMASRGLLVQ